MSLDVSSASSSSRDHNCAPPHAASVSPSPVALPSSHLFLFVSSLDLLAASIDHLATLVVGISPALYTLDHPDPQVQFLWFCKVRGYLFQICLMLSRWFVAFACLDRCALSSDQVRFRNLATCRNAYRVIIVVTVFWSVVCSHRLVFFDIKGNHCAVVNNVGAAMYHSAYVIIGGGVLPSVIMIVCAFTIRRNLARQRQRRAQLSTRRGRRKKGLEHQVHRLLFVQIIFYVIFTIPQLGNLVFNTISITNPNRSREHLAVERFVNFMAELMLYLFPVTSFYLYTLTARTFRTELIKLVRLIHGCPNRVVPQIDSTHFTQRISYPTRTLELY